MNKPVSPRGLFQAPPKASRLVPVPMGAENQTPQLSELCSEGGMRQGPGLPATCPGPPGRGTRSEGLVSEFSVCSALPEVLSGKPSLCLLSLSPGDIGGQMGLFIGASILTILELFDYIYEVRFGIARGGMTWRPHPALTSRTERGWGRARPLFPQGRLPLPVHGHCLSPPPRHWGRDGCKRDRSHRPLLRAVYTHREGAEGMRRG